MPSEASEPTALQRWLSRYVKIETRETATVIVAFFLFFFVLGSYFAVRPVRETIATVLGRERVADLWLYTALFSILIVPLYGWLVGRVRRSLLLPWIYGFVSMVLVLIGFSLAVDPENQAIGAFFYVWISVLNLMLVSVFWSFLLEIFSSEQTKRLFGFIAAGGTAGALVGPLGTRLVVDIIGNSGVLYVGAAGFFGAIICQRILLGIWVRDRSALAAVAAGEAATDAARPPVAAKEDKGLGGNPLAGLAIVFRSPYLLGIALFVTLLSSVNTFLYFEQLRIVEETFSDRARRTEVFANIDITVQTLTILSQVFLTGRIASKLGVRMLLTMVPVVMIGAFLALAAFNTFAVIAIALVARRWGEYAFIRPGREMLFSTLDTETKYKAKNFIDVPVYRAADYVGAQAKAAIEVAGISAAGAAVVGAGLAAAWGINGWILGRTHDRAGAKAGGRPQAAATRTESAS
jgi:AAA family ATP:ADP antiporter